MKTKILLFFLLTFTFNMYSQSIKRQKARDAKEAKEIRQAIWGVNDKHKNDTKVPEKWKNESAVIIYKQLDYSYRNFRNIVTFKKLRRSRVKLMDKNSVEEYSTFKFNKNFYSNRGTYAKKKSKIFLGVKIIKPDGKEVIINVDKESVKEDNDYKLAIPNLEVGDIIDYYFYSKEPFISNNAYAFEAVETPLVNEYPIVDFKLNLAIENDFYINFKSLNGAPELKKIPTQKKHFTKYELVAKNLDKKEFPIWYYPMTGYPAIKMQVYFAKNKSMKKGFEAFLADKENTIKSNVTKKEVLDLYSKLFKPTYNLKFVRKYLKNKKFKSKEEKVKAAFYYTRHLYTTLYMEYYHARKNDIYNFGIYPYYIPYENGRGFVNFFTGFLKDNNIPYEIMIGLRRYDGNIRNLLLTDNTRFVIKVKTKKPLYISDYLSTMSTISYINPYLEGTDVYVLKRNQGSKKLDRIEVEKLPVSKYSENEANELINLTLKPDFSGFNVKMNNKYKGHYKLDKQFDRLIYSDYLFQDVKKYNKKSITATYKSMRFRYSQKIKKKMEALINKFKKEQKEDFEKSLKSGWDLSEINNFEYKIINPGRFSPDEYLEYQQSFDFDKKYIKKAGRNYIIEIGQFIGSQIEIEDKNRKREEDIHLNYPKMINTTIKLKIPEGYKVVGLDKLKKNIDNSSGAFISTPKVENNELIIEISKQYKHNYYPNEKWSEILAFIDEANQFKNEKILLKKK